MINKPRNFIAKNAKFAGRAGQMKLKTKQLPRKAKHKNKHDKY